jgi:hypothetical protein
MPTHTRSALNALQAGLHQSGETPLQLAYKEMLLPHFELGDYFVNLTFSPDYYFDDIKAGKKLRKFLDIINRKIYGVAYDKGHKFLKSASVFEQNASDGWHIHMLLESPKSTHRFDGDFAQLLVDTWVKNNWGVVHKAQKVILIDSTLEKAIKYMTDSIKPNEQGRFDVINFKLMQRTKTSSLR